MWFIRKKRLPWFFKFASAVTIALPIFKLMYDVSWNSTTFLTLCFTMTLHLFLVRIHCSIHITNSLLAAYCMCRWVSGLFNCKPRLMKFFLHFMRLKITGGLHFLFLYFIERHRWLSLAKFCRPSSSFAFDFLQHNVHPSQEVHPCTCTSIAGGIMTNRM